MKIDARIPAGPLESKWDIRKLELGLVSPGLRHNYEILVVGSGLAGASAAAALGELGFSVKVFTPHDSPRRAGSVTGQGGLNAARNYANDGDSVRRLFLETMQDGDYRSREANVYRLAQLSNAVLDHCAALGVPFNREPGGMLSARSSGGAQVARTFHAREHTGQQLLMGACSAMLRQAAAGTVKVLPRREMIDLVVKKGRARGITVRNLLTGELEAHAGHAVLLCTGGYSNVFCLSTNAPASGVSAAWAAHKRGAGFANPCFTQAHPTCIPRSGDYQSGLTPMSENLRNDGRLWVPRTKGDKRAPNAIPEAERDYFLERRCPARGNLAARDVAARAVKTMVDSGSGVGPDGQSVYLDFRDALKLRGAARVKEEYGAIFGLYRRITGDDPLKTPMRVYPAPHYAMGGLWVDYDLMTTVPGLFALGEANFSDHGANRLGASALLQGLADGLFIAPATVPGYLAGTEFEPAAAGDREFTDSVKEARARIHRVLAVKGKKTPAELHRQLGNIMWNDAGVSRSEAGLKKALKKIPELREEFWKNVTVPGADLDLNQPLEKALMVADFMELSELLVRDALERKESCGGHFREEYRAPDGEGRRDDDGGAHAAVWEYRGEGKDELLHLEPLAFEAVKPAVKNPR